MPAAENESPAREPASRGRGRGGRGRGGRGRGGRGASNAVLSRTSAAVKTGRGGSRRGRAKNFADSRVQAAYERQRHLKATYQAVAHALKPVLQELADRSIDEAVRDPESYKASEHYLDIVDELDQRLERKLAEHKSRFEQDMQLAEDMFHADNYVATSEFANGITDMEEQFYQSQENRLRILAALQAKRLPIDVADDQYEYKIITDDHFDKDFGIYEAYKDGHLVPYPSRVEGTDMWKKARHAENAAAVPPVTTAPTNTRGGRGRGRGGIKRRAAEQPEGQPTPKKVTRGTDSSAGAEARGPAPAKGLLASAAEVEETPEGTPGDEESVPASPEPPAFPNGYVSAALLKAQRKLPAREKSPPLPKNITDPDEHGFRVYNQGRTFRDRGGNSRLLAPRLFVFDEWEIGFRDTTNDSSKNHTRAKRGKYLDTPNSNGMHFDHWCNGYDFSSTIPEDFDQETVKRYGIHPKYGIPLPHRAQQYEAPSPCVMPGKPVVYIAKPSGRIHHASRSFLKVTNNRRFDDDPLRAQMKATMRRFCKLDDIKMDDISIADYVRSDEELRSKSLGTAVKELESRPVIKEEESEAEEESPEPETPPEPESTGFSGLSILTFASAVLAEQESTAKAAARPAPKPARYDAIRDVFTDAKPVVPQAPQADANIGLSMLSMLSSVVSKVEDPNAVDGPDVKTMADEKVPESRLQSTIPEPVPESDLRGTIQEPDMRSTIHESDMRSTIHESDMRSTIHESDMRRSAIQEPDMRSTIHESDMRRSAIQEPGMRSTIHESGMRSTIQEPDRRSTIMESDMRSTMHEPDMRSTIHESDMRSTMHEPDMRGTMHEPDMRGTMHEPDMRNTMHESDMRGIMHESDLRSTMHESDLRNTIREPDRRSTMADLDHRNMLPRANEYSPVVTNHGPVDPRYSHAEPPGYMQSQPHTQPPMQSISSVHGHGPDVMAYPPLHDHAVPPHQPVRPSEYPHPPPPGPPIQDRAYMPHNSYPNPDRHDVHMAAGRHVDSGFHSRRMSGYADDPAYSRAYWPQPAPPPGPPPGGISPPFQSQTLPSRIPFSQNGTADPLPPLRPPRGRNQSVEEGMMDPSMRPGLHNGLGGASYYPHGPSRSYHGYSGPEHAPPPHLQPMGTDSRILPNPQQNNQGYMESPSLGYAHVISPTYANPPMAPMAQSPQEIPPGLPALHHRSTPSGDGNKYRKLQPAPVPAHRAWPNKPELKTIPYDHKETGSAAALPSSGPTQIRGWNGKESSSDATSQRSQEQSKYSVRFAEPVVGPLSASHSDTTPSEKTGEVATKTTWETLFADQPFAKLAIQKPSVVVEPQAPTEQGTKRKASDTLEEQEGTPPIKRRLRPRKPPVEPEVVITEVRPRPRPRPKKSSKPAAPKKKKPAATTQKSTATRRAKTPKEPQTGNGARASVEIQEVRKKGKQTQPIEIPSTDEEQV